MCVRRLFLRFFRGSCSNHLTWLFRRGSATRFRTKKYCTTFRGIGKLLSRSLSTHPRTLSTCIYCLIKGIENQIQLQQSMWFAVLREKSTKKSFLQSTFARVKVKNSSLISYNFKVFSNLLIKCLISLNIYTLLVIMKMFTKKKRLAYRCFLQFFSSFCFHKLRQKKVFLCLFPSFTIAFSFYETNYKVFHYLLRHHLNRGKKTLSAAYNFLWFKHSSTDSWIHFLKTKKKEQKLKLFSFK